jgi:DNA-binding transcriptional ArsR family regulator
MLRPPPKPAGAKRWIIARMAASPPDLRRLGATRSRPSDAALTPATAPEPRFARIAAGIADPTRSRMLALLMGGGWRTAGELARAAGITAPTASGHLGQLLDAGLAVARSQGRHRYFRLADADVAHALEALSLVAERRDGTDARRWLRDGWRPLKAARSCYGHLAGELGVALFEAWLRRGVLLPVGDRLDLSADGRATLTALGVTLPRDERSPRFANRCIDWSERRDHLAGALAACVLDHGLEHDWWRRVGETRALRLTPTGRGALAAWLEAAPGANDAVQADAIHAA